MASSCCPTPQDKPKKIDWLFTASLILSLGGYFTWMVFPEVAVQDIRLHHYSHGVVEMFHQMWWGVLLGIFFVGLIAFIPKEIINAALGQDKGIKGLLRAAFAGVLLDLCNHGILMIAAKLYERGVSTGQVMAFLVASPWNSLSLTLILWALIGFWWMLLFLVLSMVVALCTGMIFHILEHKSVLPQNSNTEEIADDFDLWQAIKTSWRAAEKSPKKLKSILMSGLHDSKIVIKWLLVGVVIASAMRAFIPTEDYTTWFGPTLIGLMFTAVFATVIEVCSEGSVPIAADIFTKAGAPGNSFAFLMTGVSTDYTEVMILKETTKSWKVALFLPLITVPQILILAFILNFQ